MSLYRAISDTCMCVWKFRVIWTKYLVRTLRIIAAGVKIYLHTRRRAQRRPRVIRTLHYYKIPFNCTIFNFVIFTVEQKRKKRRFIIITFWREGNFLFYAQSSETGFIFAFVPLEMFHAIPVKSFHTRFSIARTQNAL